jgi:hypothetical protein
VTVDLLHFRRAVAPHLGQVLTAEVAAEIEASARAASAPIDVSHNPAKFGSIEHGGFTYQAERFRDVVVELDDLHREHWSETEKHRHGLPLNPDYTFMAEKERAGELVQFTIRKGAELAGHLRVYLGRSRHTGTMFASEDTLFLRAKYRPGAFMILRLLRHAQEGLHAIGVREFRANSKLVNNAGALMERMGYAPVAIEYVKIFKENDLVC